jgi:hypothetical protein
MLILTILVPITSTFDDLKDSVSKLPILTFLHLFNAPCFQTHDTLKNTSLVAYSQDRLYGK